MLLGSLSLSLSSSLCVSVCFCTCVYADDVQEYIENRGQFIWKREELPFDIAENNDELMRNINRFDYESYEERVKAFMDRQGIVEDGQASKRLADIVEKYLF